MFPILNLGGFVMFCAKCGSQVADNTAFCPNCGNPVASQVTTASQAAPAYQQPLAQPGEPALSMKWFKFQINFSLWVAAILNAANAISMLTGSMYGSDGEAELVYAVFEDLKMLDTGCGVLLLALAVFGIFTRFQLAGFKKKGPTLLTILYAGVCAFDLIYIIGCSSILPEYVLQYVDFTSFYSAIASSLVFMGVNISYFKKRAHLFVNE